MSETILQKYMPQVSSAYKDIAEGKYNKSIIENQEVRIVVYKCGTVIRIDIKEVNV